MNADHARRLRRWPSRRAAPAGRRRSSPAHRLRPQSRSICRRRDRSRRHVRRVDRRASSADARASAIGSLIARPTRRRADIDAEHPHSPADVIIFALHRDSASTCDAALRRSAVRRRMALAVRRGSARKPTGRDSTEALSRRAAERLRALHDEADRLAAEERTLLGDLRQLEARAPDQGRRIAAASSADVADGGAPNWTTLDAQIAAARSTTDVAERPQLERGSSSSTSSGRARYRAAAAVDDRRRDSSAGGAHGGGARRRRSRADRWRISSGSTTLTASRTALAGARAASLATLRADAAARAGRGRSAQSPARNALVRRHRPPARPQRAAGRRAAGRAAEASRPTLREPSRRHRASGAYRCRSRPFRGDLDWPVAGTCAAFRRRRPRDGPTASTSRPPRARRSTPFTTARSRLPARFAGFGNLVIVDHGAQTFSLYGNLREIGGQRRRPRRRAGSRSARPGVAGRAQPGCISSCAIDGRPVDPLQWLKNR